LQNETNKNKNLILEKFNYLLANYNDNPIVLRHFIDFLLVSNHSSIFNSFELKDIKLMFETLSVVTESDIDIKIENYFFARNVMGDEDKATQQLKSIKNMIVETHKYIRKWRVLKVRESQLATKCSQLKMPAFTENFCFCK
jgi:hypothetical protein